jgi:hypothetical protein
VSNVLKGEDDESDGGELCVESAVTVFEAAVESGASLCAEVARLSAS